MVFKRARVLFASLLVAGGAMVATAPVAHASTTPGLVSDPVRDNGPGYDPRGDIVNANGLYGDSVVAFGVELAQAEDPGTSDWTTQGSALLWRIDTNGDGQTDYYAGWENQSGSDAMAVTDAGFNVVCQGQHSYAHASGGPWVHTVAFSASCIGSPAHIDVQPETAYTNESGTASYDWVGDPLTFPIHLDRGSYQPTPTPTTDPTPTTTTTTQPDPSIQAAGHGGYWMVTQDGHTFPFGVPSYGDAPTASATHIEPTPGGTGYWILDANGTVYSFGDAKNLGSTGVNPGEKAVSLSATPTGNGYWIFTDKGRAINFGDARPYGDMSGVKLNGPILGSVATPDGSGYWMVGSDGGIFSFGDATFHGSTGSLKLNKPVHRHGAGPRRLRLLARRLRRRHLRLRRAVLWVDGRRPPQQADQRDGAR